MTDSSRAMTDSLNVTDAFVATTSDAIATTQSTELTEMVIASSSLVSDSSSDDHIITSTPEPRESPMAMVMSSTVAGVAVVVILLALLLALWIYFYKNKLRNMQHHQYNEKMFPNVPPDEEFTFNLSKDSFSPLTHSNSVISVIHSFHPPSYPLVKPITLNFDVDNSNSLSSGSEYFKMAETSSLSLVEMGLADKGDSSDTSSLSVQSDVTAELTVEGELKDINNKNEKSLSDKEELNNGHTKHNEIIVGSTPTSPRRMANSGEFHYDAHRSFQMDGNQGSITSCNVDELEQPFSSAKRQPMVADSGYITEKNSQEMETRQTAEVAQSSNELNDSGYLPSPERNRWMSAGPSDTEPLNISHSDDVAGNSSCPHTARSGYLPNAREVVPTGVSSRSHGTPTNQEFIDALDEVDFRSGPLSEDRHLGPATDYQISSPGLRAAENTKNDYVSNDSSKFSRSREESILPSNLPLNSLGCDAATIKDGMERDRSESLMTSGYIANTCHALSEPANTQQEDTESGISTGIFMGLSKVTHQSRESMSNQDLPLHHDTEANSASCYAAGLSIPSKELPQENDVQVPVFKADTPSKFSRITCLSLPADSISIDLQPVDDSVDNTAEDSDAFTPEDSDAFTPEDSDAFTPEDSDAFTPDCSQLEYEPSLNCLAESEAVKKCREGYISSNLTFASENVQFYFPYQKASLCRDKSFDLFNGSSGVGSSPDSLSEFSPDNLNTCHFHFEYPLQTISKEKCASFSSSNESLLVSPLNKPLHSTLSLRSSLSSATPIENFVDYNLNGKEKINDYVESGQKFADFSFT